jgi:hypothetical protein
MSWLAEIETEMKRIMPNENPGRTRTTARRIAGIALRQILPSSSDDFLKLMHIAARDHTLPVDVRSAVERLVARLDTNFTSPSIDPVNDASIIVEYVRQRLHQ